MRALVRHLVVWPFIRLNYRITIRGLDALRNTEDGAIVVANHISRLDGPFIVATLWRYARIRPTAWHAEYTHPLQWPIMKLFGAVCLGSPKHLSETERLRRKHEAKRIMKKIIDAGHPLLIFAEGGISDGTRASIPPHYSGVHDMIAANPEKPVVLVTLRGLEASLFGRGASRGPFFRRLPVTMELERVGCISLSDGPVGLNARLERYFNERVPLGEQ